MFKANIRATVTSWSLHPISARFHQGIECVRCVLSLSWIQVAVDIKRKRNRRVTKGVRYLFGVDASEDHKAFA